MIVVNGTICDKCVVHVKQVKGQQDRINELIKEQCNLIDGINAIVDMDDADNVWFYVRDDDNFVESLNDDVSVIIDAKTLRELLQELLQENERLRKSRT